MSERKGRQIAKFQYAKSENGEALAPVGSKASEKSGLRQFIEALKRLISYSGQVQTCGLFGELVPASSQDLSRVFHETEPKSHLCPGSSHQDITTGCPTT